MNGVLDTLVNICPMLCPLRVVPEFWDMGNSSTEHQVRGFLKLRSLA